ncbi:MAG: hypothetical protein AUJ52_00450 [Elusimicrobia bacterium CG1_02_63_36]|nr:MAG: hypothetical protein AUJ52_00450 [Elusimicrobia bacterium CG1_02_63_36]PIP83949.1 MAG: hypothetical protein COR54_06555 [Elusimicrobia bacterium CG22_combo_CG10-13_8_21_14_all_63_91]PJA17246.1 MAG: hypothetical protein COX66_05005 [Elusimicrobia bacterium CG_4_10_14_0_2_um_filter_63_34]PJB23873.1 MAG: hypothetical protein CO113_16660 [Elusimicrobia bacterium CG_4_9_14_3_um_filter_62_55]
MTQFEEIADFPDNEIGEIYRGLTTETMATALITAPQKVIDKFFANMPGDLVDLIRSRKPFDWRFERGSLEVLLQR